jgi:DNA topoisomerase-1
MCKMGSAERPSNLIYVSDDMPGISRKLLRKKFVFFDPDGQRITDAVEIARLNRIALPPAYTDAWYAPADNAHILATGIDAKGRKQYRYHPDFRTQQEARKFDGCSAFARRLPLIRQRVEADLNTRGANRERALASIVRLLDTGGIRIGNEAYAKANKSFGATTLRMRHAKVAGNTLHLHFRAKSGKQCSMRVSDRGLARFVRAMQDLPGQRLFQYVDDAGEVVPISSSDVNDYIRETMGGDFTAKDFRTWTASTIAFETIHAAPADLNKQEVLEAVSGRLGNTPAIARKSYIHPAVLSALDAQSDVRGLRLPRATRWLSRHERGLVEYLDAQPESRLLLCA